MHSGTTKKSSRKKFDSKAHVQRMSFVLQRCWMVKANVTEEDSELRNTSHLFHSLHFIKFSGCLGFGFKFFFYVVF